MPKLHAALNSFNRGEISRYALARTDIERMRLAAEEQVNWQPTVLGPMMLRPGTQYIGSTRSNLFSRLLPFVFGTNDVALLEFTQAMLRVWTVSASGETLISRAAVSTTVTNGDFSSATGWTLTATGTGSQANITAGLLELACPSQGGVAQARATVSVATGDQNVEHAFRIDVRRGPVRFRCGSTLGGDEYISETILDTGLHSLAFTPTGASVYIDIDTITSQLKYVDSITIESSGAMELTTPWIDDDLPLIRYDQSGDIVFVACDGRQQRKIERRSARSWSVVLYQSNDGPFQSLNTTDITITPSAVSGNVTLTSSRALFRTDHVGALFRLFSSGQAVQAALSAENTFSNTIRVTGVGTSRLFSYGMAGTWSGTITLQRSLESDSSGFVDIQNYTSNTTPSYNDALDNTIVWYRLGFKTGNYTSGTATVSLSFAGGGDAGYCRITGLLSSTAAEAEVLSDFSSTTATSNWAEGDWSDLVGWPSAVAFHDGRLWWAGRDRIWGSVSDNYYSFDIDYAGDAGPINRSVGFGPVDTINWLLPMTRLIVGREGAETSIRSSSLDEPLTPTNFSLKDCSTQGSGAVGAFKIDTRGVFVQQSGCRVYELAFSVDAQDYRASDLTRLNPEIMGDGVVDVAIQRQPDTQMHFARADGQDVVLLHDVDDQVEAWWRISTSGAGGVVESVCVLPGSIENRVYYSVKRTINGSTVRYLERLARKDQCKGLPEARCADSHLYYSGSATTTIAGLSHLEGESVVVWGWNTSSPFTVTMPDGSTATIGKDLGTFTVSGGQITGLASAVTNAIVGLSYSATFKSAKLAYAAQMGTALTQTKKVDQIGLILANTHAQGLEYGQDFTTMDSLPLVEDGMVLDSNTVWEEFDKMLITLPGDWDTDARLCLRATAPRPAMVLGAVVSVTTNEDD